MTSWYDVNRVVTGEPSVRDHVVVVLADGKRIEVSAVDRYAEVLARANLLASRTKAAVKVLPMTIVEFANFIGVDMASIGNTPAVAADLRRIAVQTLKEAMVEAPLHSTRIEARSAMRAMGEAV